ncbi:MAG: hypothetical protein V4550_12540 [Gemmatimonadota bacterium]
MTRQQRHGGALVIAIAILTLGAALLTGSSAASRRAARSSNSFNWGMLAEAESMRVLSDVIATGWPDRDSLPIGGDRRWDVGPRSADPNGATATTTVRLHRLSSMRFVVAVDCRIGPEDAVVARRRRLALLDQPLSTDSISAILLPTLIPQWGIADIY